VRAIGRAASHNVHVPIFVTGADAGLPATYASNPPAALVRIQV
jgi:hypothetical protein